jgi:hypothetical protein
VDKSIPQESVQALLTQYKGCVSHLGMFYACEIVGCGADAHLSHPVAVSELQRSVLRRLNAMTLRNFGSWTPAPCERHMVAYLYSQLCQSLAAGHYCNQDKLRTVVASANDAQWLAMTQVHPQDFLFTGTDDLDRFYISRSDTYCLCPSTRIW